MSILDMLHYKKVFPSKKIAVVVCAVLLCSNIISQEKNVFELNWTVDGIIGGGVVALNATGFLLTDKSVSVIPENHYLEHVPVFDRWAAHAYSKPLDITGDVFQYTSFLLPTVLVATDSDQWLTIGVMYAEATLLSYGLKNLGKNVFPRYRPYTYFEDAPLADDNDFRKSFPSGHTTMAFTGATFTSYVFAQYFSTSVWKTPVIAGSYMLAGTTAAMRMASGNHFFSDVLAGAALGSLSGFLIPYLHKTETNINKFLAKKSAFDCKISLNPSCLYVSLNF